MPFTSRFARPDEVEKFITWAVENTDIPREDLLSIPRHKTTRVMVVEDENGEVVLYYPFYCIIEIGYFGFNPEVTDPKKRLGALNAGLPELINVAKAFGIGEIQGMTKEGYGMAEWSKKRGFVPEPRQAFKLEIEGDK